MYGVNIFELMFIHSLRLNSRTTLEVEWARITRGWLTKPQCEDRFRVILFPINSTVTDLMYTLIIVYLPEGILSDAINAGLLIVKLNMFIMVCGMEKFNQPELLLCISICEKVI